MSWDGEPSHTPESVPVADYRGKTVLIIGGTGFVGGRLAERLALEHGAHVRILVRKWCRAVWASRYALKLVPGDLSAGNTLSSAMQGVDVVFNCATGQTPGAGYRSTHVDGTRNFLEAALAHHADRVVYVSTTAVHKQPWPDCLDADLPLTYTGRDYGDTKIDAEELVREYGNNYDVQATVIRPSYVWGPRGHSFTVNPLRAMRSGTFTLVDRGEGACHAVYVDNLVDALLLAGSRKQAIGKTYIVTDGQDDITWADFYGYYARWLGIDRLPSVNSTSLLSKICIRANGTLSGLLERLSPNPAPIWRRAIRRSCYELRKLLQWRPLPPAMWDLHKYAWHGRIDITKTASELGYRPRFSLAEGMTETERWVRDQMGDELGIVD